MVIQNSAYCDTETFSAAGVHNFTVTDPKMTRFNLTLPNAINFVLNCSSKMLGGEVFVPKLKSYNILQLCKAVNSEANVEIVGSRPGEKIHECMINAVETDNCYECDNYFVILNRTVMEINHNLQDYMSNYEDKNIKKREEMTEYISGQQDLLPSDELKTLIDMGP